MAVETKRISINMHIIGWNTTHLCHGKIAILGLLDMVVKYFLHFFLVVQYWK